MRCPYNVHASYASPPDHVETQRPRPSFIARLTEDTKHQMHTTRLRRGLRHAAHISGAAIACASVSTSARAQSAAPRDSLVVTHHQVVVGGRTLKYTATAGLLPIMNNDAGEPHGRMFFVAYTLDRSSQPARASAHLSLERRPGLQLVTGAPARVRPEAPRRRPRRIRRGRFSPAPGVKDNQETWLDESDLVFVDPVGTGLQPADQAGIRIRVLQCRRVTSSWFQEHIRVYLYAIQRLRRPALSGRRELRSQSGDGR